MTRLTAREVEDAQRHLVPAPDPVGLTAATVAALDEHAAWMRLKGLREGTPQDA